MKDTSNHCISLIRYHPILLFHLQKFSFQSVKRRIDMTDLLKVWAIFHGGPEGNSREIFCLGNFIK